MENYQKVIIDGVDMINAANFSYNATLNNFQFDYQFKEIDEDFMKSFTPNLNLNDDLKSRLENEILKLKNQPGEFQFEASYHSKTGIRYYSITGKSKKDEPNIILGRIYDITNEKTIINKIVQAEKLRSLGELASGIAHDFNNQLMVILGSCEILKTTEMTERQNRYLTNIYQSAKTSSELIRKLLTFGHREEESMYSFDLCMLLDDINSIMIHTNKNKATLHYHTNIKEAFIVGSKSMIENAIINIIKNGIEAMQEKGNIHLELSYEYLSEQPTNAVMNCSPSGYYYKLEITDDGTGIKASILDKIFHPFFSTKDVQKGTGLGLSTVLGTMEQHDGIITVSSMEGVGSTFTLYFKADREPVYKKEKYKVMVVDDEELVRSIIAEMLKDLNYDVVVFESGAMAKDYYKMNRGDIDIVISDMRMPKMNGVTLYQELKKLNTDLKFILLSGYVADSPLEENESTLLLAKPIMIKSMDEAIKKLLNI